MALAPIWKDYNVTLYSGYTYSAVDFEVRVNGWNGSVIYAGRAHRRPDAADITARINDICADYIAAVLPRLTGGYTFMGSAETFYVVAYPGGVATQVVSVTFWNDWSYDPEFDPLHMDLAYPINGIVDPRQLLFYSVLPGANSVTATIHYHDGTSEQVVLPIYGSGDFSRDFSPDFSIAVAGASGTAVLDLSQYTGHGGAARVVIGGTTYTVADRCRTYCVYYVNAYGGWDQLVLDGQAARRDDLVRYTMAQDYDNTQAAARGRKDYAIEVTPAWDLRTGLLSDDASLRMDNLINSTEVYLCELATGRFQPVLLTDTSADRKTYKSNGARPNAYTVNAQLAQERFRR